MTVAYPLDPAGTVATCPVTGLPIVSRPEWTDCGFGSAFRFTACLIGDRILLNQPRGVADLQDAVGAFALIDKIVRDHIDTSSGYIHLSDYSGMRGISREARQYYVGHMERRESLLGLVYFNVSPIIRMIIRLAKRFSMANSGVSIVEDYDAAMAAAMRLLSGEPGKADMIDPLRHPAGGICSPDPPPPVPPPAATAENIHPVVDRLLHFIGDIAWERQGAPMPASVEETHPFRPVFDAIALIKEELDDILEKRSTAEKALLESRQRFEEVLTHSRDILFKRDVRTGAYEYMSEAVDALLGMSAQSACRKGFEEIKARIHPGDLHGFVAFHKKLQETVDPKSVDHPVEYRIRARDGDYRWMSETAAVIPDADGNPAFVIGSNRDVSHIKALETERQQMTERLLRSRKLEAVSTLAGGVAHNFNNLLMVVLGNLELMRMDVPTGDALHRHIDAAEKSAQRAANLSTLMLTYVGQTRISPQAIDLNVALSEMVDVLKTTVADNATLTVVPGSSAAWVHVDSGKLFQMISNLVTNAVEASDEQPLEIRFSVDLKHLSAAELFRLAPGDHLASGQYVSLQVSDNGCGMDSETVDKVFDPFFTTKFTGRGLGMAAVMGIMRAHYGGVHIDSRINGGTTVTAYFPAHQPQPSAPAQPRAAADHQRRTVLLVDDEPMVLELGEQMFRRLGCDVLTATDGVAALSVFQANRDRIHLAVLDIEMPRMDGRQTLVRLREYGAQFPVLVASGFIEAQAREKLRDAKVDGFIQKPFHVSQLEEKIEAIFNPQPV